MKIVVAYNYDPSNLRAGGGITYVHNLLKHLINRRDEVIIFGCKLSENQIFKHSNLEFIPVLNGTDNWWKFLLNLPRCIKSVNISNSYIIHAHHPLTMYPFINIYPKNPKVCTFHGVPLDWIKVNYLNLYPIIKPIYEPIEKHVVKNVDIITAAGTYPKVGLKERYPDLDLDKKIVVVGSGVDLCKFRPMNKYELRKKYGLDKFNTIILFLGRLSEQKNLKLLLKSFSLTANSLENSALVIVGRGEKEEELKQFTKKLNIKNVIFTGEVKSEEVPELLNFADVFALTSWYEASPTVVKEALTCGIPVITTNVGDVKDIITNPLLGTIVDTYEEKFFAEALIKTIKIVKAKPREVREQCREVALDRFSFERVAKDFILVYEEAVTMRGQK